MSEKDGPCFKRWHEIFTGVVLFLLAFLPRIASLGTFMTVDESAWVQRSAVFFEALKRRDWSQTLVNPTPAVTTMWTGAIGFALKSLFSASPPDDLAASLQAAASEQVNADCLVAIRLPTVLLTAACVVVVYLLVRKLFGFRVALLSAVLLAIDPFYLANSRVIHHDALVTSFMTISVLSMMVYLRRQRSFRYLFVSGVTAGLAFLTKSPALYLIPFTTTLIFAEWLGSRHCLAKTEKTKLVKALITLIVWAFWACVVFFALWPAMWVDSSAAIDAVLGNVGLTMQTANRGKGAMFLGHFVKNDPGILFYLVAWPLTSSPVVLLGLGAAIGSLLDQLGLKCVFKGESNMDQGRSLIVRTERVDMLALVAYAALFIVTMSLGAKKSPRYLLPVFPALNVVAAVGWWWLADKLMRRHSVSVLRWRGLRGVAIVIVMLIQAVLTLIHHPYYFTYYDPLFGGGWLAQKVIKIGWGEGLDKAARYLDRKENAVNLKVATWHEGQFTLFFSGETVDLFELDNLLSSDYVVFYVDQVQRGYPDPNLLAYFQSRRPERVVRLKGIDYAWVYPGPIYGFGAVAGAQHPLGINLANKVQLVDYELQNAPVESGKRLHVVLQWRCLAEIAEDYNVYLRLVDRSGHVWGQVDRYPVAGFWTTTHWQPGMIIVDEYDLDLLPGAPPGEYELEVGMYSIQTMQVLNVVSDGRIGAGGGVVLGSVSVTKSHRALDVADLNLQHLTNARLSGEIELVGYNFDGETVGPGDRLALTLYWQAKSRVKEDYIVSLRLKREAGVAKEWQSRPVGGRYPTTEWDRGEVVADQLDLTVPANVLPGKYELIVGLIEGTTRKAAGKGVALGTITVVGRPREFELPPIENPVGASLGEQVELLGYQLSADTVAPGRKLRLTLHWRASSEMETSYTVFVHLLDQNEKIWWQRDSVPGNGTLPTTGWVAGEVISEGYDIMVTDDTPPGEYIIEVGMYDATNGQRLPILDDSGDMRDDRILLGIITVADRNGAR